MLDEIGQGLVSQSPLRSDYNLSPSKKSEKKEQKGQEEKKEIIKIWKFEPIVKEAAAQQTRNAASMNPLHSFSLRIKGEKSQPQKPAKASPKFKSMFGSFVKTPKPVTMT